nr:MAG TPA: hypothetical protein [Caudoviricetes sp.]
MLRNNQKQSSCRSLKYFFTFLLGINCFLLTLQAKNKRIYTSEYNCFNNVYRHKFTFSYPTPSLWATQAFLRGGWVGFEIIKKGVYLTLCS